MKKSSGVVGVVKPRSSTTTGGSGSSGKKKSSCPSSSSQQQQQQHKFPVEPVVISVVNKPREFMNHSYRDFSNVPAEIDHEHVTKTKIADMTFSQKVHDILRQPEYKACINWHPHGRSFKIFVPMHFERIVCEKYFGHKRYSSFLRQLNNFGFKHISKGPDRNSYYHELFLEGRPHLCKYMPLCKDARRLVPDPENEPDFYKISAQYPLKVEQQSGGVDKNVPEEVFKPAAKQQPEHPAVTSSCDAPAVNAAMISSLSAVVPAATGPAASMAPPPPMTLSSQMESVAPPRMGAYTILPPATAFAAAGSSAHVTAAGCGVSSANLLSSPTAAASTLLGSRLASEVSWLLQQLPPAKVHRSASATTPLSYHSAAAVAAPDAAVWLRALDVAQARRQHEEAAAAASASLARQQQLLQQEEVALIAAVEAAQVRQESALLAAVQQRKQQIVSRLLLGVDARVHNSSSSSSSGLNAAGGNDTVQGTSALLDYIRRMQQQHDG